MSKKVNRARYKMTLDVTFTNIPKGREDELRENLEYLVSHALGEGMLTLNVDEAEVEEHIVRISELQPKEGKVVRKRGDLELLEDGNIRGTVSFNIAEFTEHESMLEKYLDILSEKLTGTGLLSDIRDRVVDVGEDMLVVEVEGDPSMIEDGPAAELVRGSDEK